MSEPAEQSTHLRFGGFDLDLRSGELLKSGRRVHLAPLPSKILAYLARHPGRVISREELCRQVAPPGATGENGRLGACIRQIRTALQDPAVSPRFIETLRRRGYRFRPPVEVLATDNRQGSVRTGIGAASTALRRAFPALTGARRVLGRALGVLPRRSR
jgi:DNA-binding winged helix-turn-helix (wHTH) protein